ncbi:MAG TPA: SLC13 family permease [Anaerolineales bacterium]|nr:SLC13 family permease [Anaerolineales bacterium]
MTFEIALLLGIIILALVLFSVERFPTDIVAIGLLILLVVTGLLPVERAFAGFGSDAVIVIFCLLVLTAAMIRTGVVEQIGRVIIRRVGNNPNRVLAASLIAPAMLGAFISNTASAAFFLPVLIGVGRQAKISISRLLMPMAFATILTSSVTLISTSTNIVVSSLMVQNGQEPLGMFELAPVGIPIAIIGIIYMYFIGIRLVPDRVPTQNMLGELGTKKFLSEIRVEPDSSLVGKTLAQSGLGRDLDLTVLRLVRGDTGVLIPQADTVLEADDVLVVEGWRDEILKVHTTSGIKFKADVEVAASVLQDKAIRLAEVILLLRSPLVGRSLARLKLREQYGIQVLAISRHGETIDRKLSRIVLQLGDILLIQGHINSIAALEGDKAFRILTDVDKPYYNKRQGWITVGAFVGSLLLAAFGLVSLPVAFLIGCLIVFVTRCITPEEAYREIEWKAIILIGSMLAMGAALDHTGAAKYLAAQIVTLVGDQSPVYLLGGFFILCVLLTQPMSNQAAAVVVVPIAIHTAAQLGLNPRTFTVMIAIASSCSFITPLEPANLMVYGPGRYKFFDFVKVGSLLTVIIFLISIFLVPIIWPL